ncbi:uncharacterized protein LOC141626221 [Silene latifolia]|uniref:uncharacterized protein LOC141626221 n=1 Tax=Silene latifolia TaxID=37657 RepID=UPI003D78011F
MSQNFENALKLWLDNLTKDEKDYVIRVQLGPLLLSLKQVKISWEFLRAATLFWDPEVHVFRFGDREICPMTEEFSVILGLSVQSPPALSNLDDELRKDFRDYLGITSRLDEFLNGRRVNLCRLIAHFTSPSYPRTVIDSRYNKRALVLFLLNHFLFVSPSTIFCHGCLLKVVKHMRNDCSPMALVLAETLHCLDTLRRNPEAAFCGSPLILQVWLQEHMRLIERPLDPLSYRPHNFAGRQRVIKGERSLSFWRDWMSNEFPIRWTIPWWRIHAMTAPRSSVAYYRLPGLTHSSFIFPSCLLR